jgi:alpha-tubulin suppressor-like RCC1 family protein
MAFTQITSSNLDNTINTKLAAAEAANAAVANIVSLAISSVQIADSSYNVLDDTAANTGGGYLVINGTGFTNQCVVIVGTTNATSTTFANTKQLRAQVPALSAATYPVYVVDSVTGATAIKVNGLTYSPFPAWSTGSTLSNQAANTSFAVSLSANSDSSVTYANTTALPAGTTLAANGYFSGTVTIGAQTTYSFDVKATDVENQDATRTFSLTVTVTPPTRLYSWGFNTNGGQLGQNDRVNKSSPTQVGTGTDWNLISVGTYNTIATKTDGTLWAWGYNNAGQLGLNDIFFRSSPTQVGTGTNWNLISIGNYNTIATKTDGTLWAWGYNLRGQLGLNDTTYKSSPIQVGTGTNWSKISIGYSNTIATKTDGTLWTWGFNNTGQLGQSIAPDSHRSSPIQVGTETNWNLVAAGQYNDMATKTDGTLWAWGYNIRGQLGQNNRNDKSSPVQVGSETNWNSISISTFISLATKTDGTLWTWGQNDAGQLGQSDVIFRSSPVQVGTGTNWNLIRSAQYSTIATKTDGTLWTWGQGNNGQLGLNNITNKSSPTQVGTGTNWSKISGGNGSILAITAN